MTVESRAAFQKPEAQAVILRCTQNDSLDGSMQVDRVLPLSLQK